MLSEWLPAFLDEVEKVASDADDPSWKQTAKFTALGATAVPAVHVIKNLITHGHAFKPGVSKLRSMAAESVGGALASGVLPTVRHHLEESVQDAKRKRRIAKVSA